MKKRIVLSIVIFAMLMCGCISPRFLEAGKTGKIGNDVTAVEKDGSPDMTNESDTEIEEAISVPEGFIALKGPEGYFTGMPVTDRYYRSKLSESEQKIYDEIYVATSQMLGEVELSTVNPEIIEKIVKAVMDDFPELYFITNYKYTKYVLNDEIQSISYVGNYSKTAEEVDGYNALIDEYINNIKAAIMPEMDDFETAKAVYEYIIYNTDYVRESADSQNVLSVIVNGESVCMGYARTYQLVMQRLGYEAVLINGIIKETNEQHAWVAVKLNGEFYHVDPTWGDISIEGFDKEAVNPLTVGYAYLCVPENWLENTHVIDNLFPYPECTSIQDNYYVRNNIYVESEDDALMKSIISSFLERDESIITFRCSDRSLYDYWINNLFNEKHIFDYVNKKLFYILDDNTYVIIISCES